MAWLYVPGLAGSSSESPSSAPTTAPSVMWRGKPTPLQRSRAAWKTVSSSPLLSGVTSEPSTRARGVASWISSLRATRASPSAARVSVLAQLTRDTYGPTSIESSEPSAPEPFSARTSELICPVASLKSPETWKSWATALRRACSRRGLSVRPTSGSVFSGSHLPTPSATSYGTSQNEGQVEHKWPSKGTPSLETMARRGELRVPTPTAGGGTGYVSGDGRWRPTLNEMAKRGSWPTPRASEAAHSGRRAANHGGQKGLAEAVHTHAQQTGGQLNPTWVEWLMGFPLGWTASEPLETQSYQRWRREHSPSSPRRSSDE